MPPQPRNEFCNMRFSYNEAVRWCCLPDEAKHTLTLQPSKIIIKQRISGDCLLNYVNIIINGLH